ncbi:codanin-1-like [Watersipora subatra]|uniref:codanin-1-like n=1 Tax=Watersipora subatra TaxID=2589382 RepID=UPI00355C0648
MQAASQSAIDSMEGFVSQTELSSFVDKPTKAGEDKTVGAAGEEKGVLNKECADTAQYAKDRDDVLHLDGENSALQAEDAALQAEDAALQAEDAALHAEDAALLSEDAGLQAEDAALQVEDAALQAEDAALQAEDAVLHTEDAALQAENAALQAEDAALQAEDAALQAEDAALQAESVERAQLKILLSPHTSAAEREFLIYIYDQVNGLLQQSVSQANSRSNTPLSTPSTLVTPIKPVQAPKFKSPSVVEVSQKCPKTISRHQVDNPKRCDVNNPLSNEAGKRGASKEQTTPRRVQLFSEVQTPDKNKSWKNEKVRHAKTLNSSQTWMTGSSSKEAVQSQKEQASPFRPLLASSPASLASSLHHTVTFGDYLSSSRQTKRNNRRRNSANRSTLQADKVSEAHTTSNDTSNSSCGSWALGLSANEITPITNELRRTGDLEEGVSLRPANDSQGKESNSVKPSRRITPTLVSSDSRGQEFRQQAVFIPESPKRVQASTPGDFSEERRRLREKKAQIMIPIAELGTGADTQSSNLPGLRTPSKHVSQQLEREPCVEPALALVTNRDDLDKAAEVLSRLINAGQTDNIAEDLHLMIQLLCCQIPEDQTQHRMSLLNSLHNGVYFSIALLAQCEVLQAAMDQSMKRLLGENERLIRFNPHLAKGFTSSNHVPKPRKPSSFLSVAFQTDTDDSKNFPSDSSFLAFKKQRDIFYEVKREWDSNEILPGWSLAQSCSQRIRQLLDHPSADTANHVHLSRLFIGQLTLSCLQGLDSGWTDENDKGMNLLSELRYTQPEKYKKLRERFVKPTSITAHCTRQVKFSGQEAFFKSFIDAARDATFSQHLKDSLTLRLLSIDSTEFDEYDEQDVDSALAMENLSDCVLTSRLLAKFLGYLHFQPYACREKKKTAMAEQYMQLRSITQPPLDVAGLLQKAMHRGRCLLTVPWLVQYLSQVDYYTRSLPYYRSLLASLRLHLNHLKHQLTSLNFCSNFVQYVNLTWFFSLSELEGVNIEPTDRPDWYNEKQSSNIRVGLDNGSISNMTLPYECSDTLKAAKNTLLGYLMGLRSKGLVSRKITPLTAPASSSVLLARPVPCLLSSTQQSHLQQALEENFFHNQPTSLKKTVTFLGERISSSYIKEFRGKGLSDGLLTHKLLIHERAKGVACLTDVKATLFPFIACQSSQLHNKLCTQALDGFNIYFTSRIEKITQLLLPSETESPVLMVCNDFALRHGLERVHKWLTTNLTLSYITAELTQEVTKYCRTGGNCPAPNSQSKTSFIQLGYEHSDTAPSPSRTLLQMQNIVGSWLTHPKRKVSGLAEMLEKTARCVTGRNDIEDIAMRSICSLLVSALVQMAVLHRDELTERAMKSIHSLLTIRGLEGYWNDLMCVVPEVEGLEGAESLSEKLCNYILYQKGLMKVVL